MSKSDDPAMACTSSFFSQYASCVLLANANIDVSVSYLGPRTVGRNLPANVLFGENRLQRAKQIFWRDIC